ncbi:DUF222 domain-containing protein [Geodermatophilus obscurus]|uniref:DUF222 domain-containing protein n=1 Tax=Geodermatophilus obscurus (strain ATCC 25078 / DSM 43160 / JCM 3152 / CCUG 61914 / KCC A-0152 / KCTC 9177 / NBRC 13315 / NRRL B-3577 / G-20) TaxID=526225 RepID=D2SA28_GEOOG|nr:hypothetical protein Gobs_3238 [Geodermatophilus obscurus DSM 43160]
MEQLLAALDALAAEDLASLFGPALLDRLRPLLVAQNRLAAEVARTVREAEVSGAAEVDGLKTMGSWLRGHAHLSASEAARVVRTGRALAQLPVMAAACAAGQLTGEQAAVIGRVAEPEHLAAAADQHVDVAEVDAVLTEVAVIRPYADTATAVHHYLDRLDADGPEPDPTEGRRLSIAKHADGSTSGRFDLDAVGGEKLQTALESLPQAGRCAADERTRAQQLADGLVQLCDTALAAGGLPTLRGHKPQVIVKIGIEDLVDPAVGRRCRRDGLRRHHLRRPGPLDRLRRGRHPDRAGTGRAAAGARPHRAPGATARAPGRGSARRRLRVHRLRRPHALVRRPPPARVGRRRPDQPGQQRAAVQAALAPCVHHGFRVKRQPDGRWRTWRPDGTEIRTGPGRTGPPLPAAA